MYKLYTQHVPVGIMHCIKYMKYGECKIHGTHSTKRGPVRGPVRAIELNLRTLCIVEILVTLEQSVDLMMNTETNLS